MRKFALLTKNGSKGEYKSNIHKKTKVICSKEF